MTKTTAQKDGWFAHKNGAGVDENPYNERLQRQSNSEWLDGWCERFGACKHGQLTEFEAMYEEYL